jgi:hypothetical protein
MAESAAMIATELQRLHGQSVLVKYSRDPHNPPIGKRGTIEVHEGREGGRPEVKVVIDFPEMFYKPAHQRTLVLTDAEVARLKPAHVGGLEFVTDQDFD